MSLFWAVAGIILKETSWGQQGANLYGFFGLLKTGRDKETRGSEFLDLEMESAAEIVTRDEGFEGNAQSEVRLSTGKRRLNYVETKRLPGDQIWKLIVPKLTADQRKRKTE